MGVNKLFDLNEKTVVVTGAASGIGFALVSCLGKLGARTVLVDIREEGLLRASEALNRLGYPHSVHATDISDPVAVSQLAQEIENRHEHVDVLVNNAGIATAARFMDMGPELFNRVMQVNFHGALNMTRSFMPLLSRRDESHLVNIASIGAYSTAPGYSAYCAAKYALRAVTETLQQELSGSSVHTLLVCPGGIRTGLEVNSSQILQQGRTQADNADLTPALNSADHAAEKICRAIQKRKTRLFIGADARLLFAFERIAPRLLLRLVNRFMNKKG